jgi:hypothetical protein
MRTTIDIPDETYRNLKMKAAREGKTVREIVLDAVAERMRSASETAKPKHEPRFPVIRSKHKDKLVIDSEKIYDLIDFP